MGRVLCGGLIVASLVVAPAAALTPEILQAIRAVPPHVAGRFRDARAFQQSGAGQHYVFDRRAHRVYGLDDSFDSTWQIVQIGGEPGRIIGPTAFSTAPDGHFAVADAPDGRPRIQIFHPSGFRVWVSLADPYTYVFDPQGDKIRTVQFRGVDFISPTGLFFTANSRLLVTPGLFEFDPWPEP